MSAYCDDIERASDTSQPSASAALALLERLSAVLERENAALRARDPRLLATLAGEKQAAMEAVERHVRAPNDPGARDGVTGDAGARLEAARARTAALIGENERRLRVAIAANRSLVETIAAAAQAHAAGAGAYAHDGRSDAAAGRKGAVPPALSFSRAL